MQPMEYNHYQDENLAEARREMERAIKKAQSEKRRWLNELAEQAAADILDRIEQNATRPDLKCNSGNLREANQQNVSWLLTNLINAVQEADRRILVS